MKIAAAIFGAAVVIFLAVIAGFGRNDSAVLERSPRAIEVRDVRPLSDRASAPGEKGAQSPSEAQTPGDDASSDAGSSDDDPDVDEVEHEGEVDELDDNGDNSGPGGGDDSDDDASEDDRSGGSDDDSEDRSGSNSGKG